MKNKMIDLNNILFEQLERLNDEELKGEELTQEISRAKSMAEVASQVVNNYRLQLDSVKLLMGNGYLEPEYAQEIMGITTKKLTE